MTSSFRAVNIDCNFDYTYERQRLDALGVQLILEKSETEEAIIQACQDADVMVVEGTRILQLTYNAAAPPSRER